jgi:hypothetical protein
VTDGIEKANFVFIRKSAEYLLYHTAYDLLAQPKKDEDDFLSTKFLDLPGKKLIFTAHCGNNKFRSNMITNQVANVSFLPPTTKTTKPAPSLTKTVSHHAPATPTEKYEKTSTKLQTQKKNSLQFL